MKILGIIPARYASTRFPGKPLYDIGGKSMIRRVYEQALQATSLHDVVVATDDERIYRHVEGFGKVVMTAATHQSGTDRCAEVIQKFPSFDAVINIQGDEPFINPKQIDQLCKLLQDSDNKIVTIIKQIDSLADLTNRSVPKVVTDRQFWALYFSRNSIPYQRDHAENEWPGHHTYYKHIGIYGYRTEVLQQITRLPVSLLEKAEALEQLRWLENGFKIRVAVTALETLSVDTPADAEKAIRYLQDNSID